MSACFVRQFCQVVFGLLAMTGRVSMRNIARWTSKGGSYRTIQRFLNTVLPWNALLGFFRTHLKVAGDETNRLKIDSTYLSPSLRVWQNDPRSGVFCDFFFRCLMEQIVKPAS